MVPEVDFQGDFPGGHNGQVAQLPPSTAAYETAIDKFRDKYIQCGACGGQARVTNIGPWNEPDMTVHQGPVFERLNPDVAAQYWVATQHRIVDDPQKGCKECIVIAGDFTGTSTNYTGAGPDYLTDYERDIQLDIHGAANDQPRIWAIHPYADLNACEHGVCNDPRHTVVTAFTQKLNGITGPDHKPRYGPQTSVWLNEVSIQNTNNDAMAHYAYHLVDGGGRVQPGLPIVTRLYYLRYLSSPAGANDTTALINNGKQTKAYQIYAHR